MSEIDKKEQQRKCGLVMPISAMVEYPATHWEYVRSIVEEALSSAFEISMVSETEEAGVIQNSIVRSLYDSDIIVCDVSGRNPNVMFELGIRLAFNKPFVIIIDNCSQVPFDVASIEYLKYPKDLNYIEINKFKKALLEKVQNTLSKSIENQDYSILKEFGKFDIAKLPENTGKNSDTNKLLNALVEEVTSMRRSLRRQEIVLSDNRRGPAECISVIDRLFETEPILSELVRNDEISKAVDFVRAHLDFYAPRSFIERQLVKRP